MEPTVIFGLVEVSMVQSRKPVISVGQARSGDAFVRFAVVGLARDRALIRSFARRLAESDAEAERLRAAVAASDGGAAERRGRILAALRRSPLVGAEIDTTRDRGADRALDL